MRIKEKELLLLIIIFLKRNHFCFDGSEIMIKRVLRIKFIHIDSFKGVKSVQKAEPF